MLRSPSLTEAQRLQALERHTLLRSHLQDGVPLTAIAREQSVPLRTLQRWLTRYRQDGLAGLVRQPRDDRGRRHFPDELIALIEGLALRRPPPSIAAIHRQVGEIAEREAWPVPSYSRNLAT